MAKISARGARPLARAAYVTEPKAGNLWIHEYLLRSDGTVLFRTSLFEEGHRRLVAGRWSVARTLGRFRNPMQFLKAIEDLAGRDPLAVRVMGRWVVSASGEEASRSLTEELRRNILEKRQKGGG